MQAALDMPGLPKAPLAPTMRAIDADSVVSPAAEEEIELRDEDRDALHILPLSIVPLTVPTLRRARMIKNMQLDGVVEFFTHPHTGSGQIDIADIPLVFEWPEGSSHPDLNLLHRLAGLPSYDVYSLRILLRDMNIPVANSRGLHLSAAKVASLGSYMAKFTRPLVAAVFGGANVDLGGAEDLVRMFRESSSANVRGNLHTIADKLDIKVAELPRFLEDCGDIFLALSYYRRCLDDIEPLVTGLLESIEEIRGNRLLAQNMSVVGTCKLIESTIVGQMAAVGGRVEKFDRITGTLWDDVSADRFKEVRQMIQGYHTAVGGVLCALTVKMKAWASHFPSPASVGAKRRANFLMSDMKQGIDKILKMEGMAAASGRLLQ